MLKASRTHSLHTESSQIRTSGGRSRDIYPPLPAQQAEESHTLFQSVTHILMETSQSIGTKLGRKQCALDEAGDISRP